ncbi:MAG TPA: hypothetical protein VFZ61_21045 [Polyangiales bacterium]
MKRRPHAQLGFALVAALPGCVLDGDLGGWEAQDASEVADVDLDATTGPAEREAGHDGDGACSSDAGACAPSDGGDTDDATLTVKLGLTTSYFADGRSLPSGQYTLTYVDGCWKSGVVAWTVNTGGEGYWVVGGEPEQRLGMAPGTTGVFANLGAYGDYNECVAANVGRPGFSFFHQGGPIGLKLESIDPLTYFILVEGGESVGGRSPTFRLTCAADCR